MRKMPNTHTDNPCFRLSASVITISFEFSPWRPSLLGVALQGMMELELLRRALRIRKGGDWPPDVTVVLAPCRKWSELGMWSE
jgi:hypothetical protein